MKKVILGIVGVIVVLGLAIGVKIYVFPEPTHLDVLSNLELTFEGMEESGKASIKGNDIQYRLFYLHLLVPNPSALHVHQ